VSVELHSATHLRRTGSLERGVEVEFAGRRLRLTNLEKPMYPVGGMSKGQVVDYYAQVAEVVLPHVVGRPLTLKRFPDGIGGAYFFEKQCPGHRPDWVQTAPIWIEQYRTHYEYCVIGEAATLVWLANLASLEVHPALARAGDLGRPTGVAFDCDPGYPAGLLEACQVALWLRFLFDRIGLESFVKSSGSKGVHVYVPLNDYATYERTKAFARSVAQSLERQSPELVTAQVSRARRAGKVLIDWGQNDRHKTIVAPYSLRANDPPTVSVPLRWEEVEQAVKDQHGESLVLSPAAMLERLQREGDLFAESGSLRQSLPG
jgi:bifunctional non-homologous end joining protein LigD